MCASCHNFYATMAAHLLSSSSSRISSSSSRFNQIPNSIQSFIHIHPVVNFTSISPQYPNRCSSNLPSLCSKLRLLSCHTKAVISEVSYQNQNYSKVGALSLVRFHLQSSWRALKLLQNWCSGEEGGVIGDSASDYLWCIDPLDGTTNFAHGYPSFAVSVGVLFRGKPAAAAVFLLSKWLLMYFSGGAFCNGQKIHVERSLLVTGFGYEHDNPWATNMALFKEFTDISRGVRRLGAAAVDMCHVALGIVEAYWEYRLKPWDMAAGVLIVEEAGGTVSRMDGGKFTVFDRSLLVSNGILHAKLLEKIGVATEELKGKGIDFSLWYKPDDLTQNYN
ncbi:hypothetical protein OSB04_000868 [Centaurea solstitialis]|uniref:Inositol-1-monophosphatase n=1 Tax=Centaurea solstitialis TaxID=347529 RepID=A0AA38WKY2_9ASTR|nr:hypothetical protein OSB04_000868 [Centaurea solstitialis]